MLHGTTTPPAKPKQPKKLKTPKPAPHAQPSSTPTNLVTFSFNHTTPSFKS